MLKCRPKCRRATPKTACLILTSYRDTSYTSRVMANFVFKFSKIISHHGNESWLDGKNLNASIYLCDPVNVLFDAKVLALL